MPTQDDWQLVCHNLVETGFFNTAGRPKTLKAIRRVMEKMPADELECLKEKVSIIFAPAPGMDGQVFPIEEPPTSSRQPEKAKKRHVLVYLSPGIERLSQRRIESTVAHEYAHALLRAPAALEGWFIEQEADRKVKSWGFRVAYLDHRTD